MHKLNKQDFIFSSKVAVYIIATFIAYLFFTQNFITDNCHILSTLWGLGSMPYVCFWYLRFFEENSIYFYFLFLWITLVPFIQRKYTFPSKIIFGFWTLILLFFLVYIYRTTHIVFFEDLPQNQQQLYLR